jgi:putative transposase
MLGISRWIERYSYKTVERFFDKKIEWLSIKWQMIKGEIGKEVILVADESTVSKSGKSTYGLGYFYSGLQNRAIKGISFLSFSLVDVESQRAYPLLTKHLKREKGKKVKSEPKKRVGRPKGSKNKNSEKVRLKGLFRIVGWYLRVIQKVIKIPTLRYFVYDGAFGNNAGVQTAKRANLYLISKLKKNSSLYFKFKGEQKSRGRKRIYWRVG